VQRQQQKKFLERAFPLFAFHQFKEKENKRASFVVVCFSLFCVLKASSYLNSAHWLCRSALPSKTHTAISANLLVKKVADLISVFFFSSLHWPRSTVTLCRERHHTSGSRITRVRCCCVWAERLAECFSLLVLFSFFFFLFTCRRKTT
jgi:hypothetical protein